MIDHLMMTQTCESERKASYKCVQYSENMNNNEFLPRHYTDLTFEAEIGSIHSAPNLEYQDFFKGFHL